MSLDHLHKLLPGLPVQSFLNQKNGCKTTYTVKRNSNSRTASTFSRRGHSQKWNTGVRFPHFCRGSAYLPLRNSGSSRLFRINCTKESFSEEKASIRSFSPLWKEGMLFVRCSLFFAVISATGLLVWFAQLKARSFVEARLLPSVCSILSEHLQREIGFGKVRSISPLSITLDDCSIGPYREEFSCGEVSSMKLRLCPFASLRSGKIVVNAVLFQPSLLVAQKKDYSWLGIPAPSENGFQRHHSTEEGIDFRTKTRRLAREESALRWDRERVNAAREAAELGYIVPEGLSKASLNDGSRDGLGDSPESVRSSKFFCMDERMHWSDNHCMDTGTEYGQKHADLEKSFGVKSPGYKLWSRMKPDFMRSKFKRNTHKRLLEAKISSKQRNLKRSADASLAYFHSLANGKPEKRSSPPEMDSSGAGCIDTGVKATAVNGGEFGKTDATCSNMVKEYRSQDIQKLDSQNIEENLIPTSNQMANMNFVREENYNIPNDNDIRNDRNAGNRDPKRSNQSLRQTDSFSSSFQRFLMFIEKIKSNPNFLLRTGVDSESGPNKPEPCPPNSGYLQRQHIVGYDQEGNANRLKDSIVDTSTDGSEDIRGYTYQRFILGKFGICTHMHRSISLWPFSWKPGLPGFPIMVSEILSRHLARQIRSLKSYLSINAEDITAEIFEGVDGDRSKGIEKVLPITLDSVYFSGGTLMLLGYGDREPREMDRVSGHVKFQNHYSRIHVQLSGDCMEWRSDNASRDGGHLSVNVFVDTLAQKWHANLRIRNLFAPLFERILELPITWYKGRASGEVHICMSEGDTFPNLHGQLDVNGLSFQILDAPSSFSELAAILCFRGQRIFLHNASGRFGDAPLEASGDFGINPDSGEFHLMCQVLPVEVNTLMKTLKMRPLMFPLAGSVTAVFNCQGPLDAPILVGSGMISRKTSYLMSNLPPSTASDVVLKNKEAGAVAAFDRIPFSYVSANFTFNLDNSVVDLYGIRASLLDGGEIRGAGNAWICPEGEVDDTAIDVNLSGKFLFDKVLHRYFPDVIQLTPLKIGELNGETKLSGSILRPRFDIKWAAPKAEDSFSDARGDIIISQEYIQITSSSIAFDLHTQIQTSYPDDYWVDKKNLDIWKTMPLIVQGVDLDLRLRGFEFANLISSTPFDTPRPLHLKASGKIKFQGNVQKPTNIIDDRALVVENNQPDSPRIDNKSSSLIGEVSMSGIRLNQLMLAPQLAGSLTISPDAVKLDASGRPDENLTVEFIGPLRPSAEETLQKRSLLSVSLQKGQLTANICYQPHYSANLEVRQLPLDELELASLRGTIQRAGVQLNFQKRRGHGSLSVLRPKFSGVLGEVLDVAARWSGDVITIEKTILEQASSRYELQGEYVLPGIRDRYPGTKRRDGLFRKAMVGQLGSVMSSLGRWRLRLEVPGAEVSEMLPLARLLSRSTDPDVRSRSKDLFIQMLQSVGFGAESLHGQLEAIQNHYKWSDDNILEDIALPGLAEFRGFWRGSLDASGGGEGDTMADFDFHGEDWEWGSYKTQRIVAAGAYTNNDGLRLEKLFIQKDDATLHADGTVLGPITNLHFAVLNFPVGLVPTLVQIIESSSIDSVHSLRQFLTPIKGILHMEGDLRGSLAKPECDVEIRLLDGAIGGIDLGRAEFVASITPSSRFLFNANFEPVIQSGHVHVQGSIPVVYIQNDSVEEIDKERDRVGGAIQIPVWIKESERGPMDGFSEKKLIRDKAEDGWDFQLTESLKGLNWSLLDAGEVRINADIKDGGMMLITALCPYVSWLHGYADVILQVKGTVEQPVIDGSASFHKASVSSPVLRKPLTNLGGTVQVASNRLCISSMESRVSRKGKLFLKGNLPLKTSESSGSDKLELKCEVLEVRAKNTLSGQVDSQIQVTGSILEPNITGMIKLSHGEAYLPHDKGNGAIVNGLASNRSTFPGAGYSRMASTGPLSRFFGSLPASSHNKWSQPEGKQVDVQKKLEEENSKLGVDVRLSDLKLVLGPELRIVYPLILNFAVSGELELNGIAHPKYIKPKGVLTFENGDINLVATQVRLKRDHLNVAKFEPDLGLDPILDLALVGSEWQFRIQSRASTWQDNLVVTSTRSVDQDVLTPSEAARVFESQLAESLLESDGQLAFKKLATSTLETLMPRIEGKGEFGQARWRIVYAPQILSVDPTVDPLKSLANNISFGTEVEVQLGKRLQASVVRQMKESEMAMQWTLSYQLTNRLRVLFQSVPSNRLLFEYSATTQG